MFIALIIATALTALLVLNSAIGKLRKNEQVLTSIVGTVRFPERLVPLLAALEIAGAIGIVAGIWLRPLGIAAAIGLVLYFVAALIGHLRVGDKKGGTMPLVPLALSIAVLVLRLVVA